MASADQNKLLTRNSMSLDLGETCLNVAKINLSRVYVSHMVRDGGFFLLS